MKPLRNNLPAPLEVVVVGLAVLSTQRRPKQQAFDLAPSVLLR